MFVVMYLCSFLTFVWSTGVVASKFVWPKVVAVLITFYSSCCRCTSKFMLCMFTECMSDSNGKVTVSYNPTRARLQNTRLFTVNLKRQSQSQSIIKFYSLSVIHSCAAKSPYFTLYTNVSLKRIAYYKLICGLVSFFVKKRHSYSSSK